MLEPLLAGALHWGVLLLAGAVMLAGVLGTLVPALPGLPLIWIVAFLYGWYEGFRAISPGYLLFLGLCVAAGYAGEYAAKAWGARRFGGGRGAAWGAVIGSILGLFFLPVGLFLGPFLGAFIGELVAGRQAGPALKAGLGGVIGVFLGTGLHVALALVMFISFLQRAISGGA